MFHFIKEHEPMGSIGQTKLTTHDLKEFYKTPTSRVELTRSCGESRQKITLKTRKGKRNTKLLKILINEKEFVFLLTRLGEYPTTKTTGEGSEPIQIDFKGGH